MRQDSSDPVRPEAVLAIAWIVIGGLYGAWIVREALATWNDSSAGLRIYYAIAFLSGAALALLGLWQLTRPVRNRVVRSAAFVLPALLLANHVWAMVENVLLCASPG